MNAILRFELENGRKPVVAMMGVAFKPDIDDLRESPAKAIISKVMQSAGNSPILVVEPNVAEHNVFKLTPYKEAYAQADIAVFLTAHTPFRSLEWDDREDYTRFLRNFQAMSVENEKPRQVDLRGVMVYPFSNPDKLIDFADERKGILVAINAEKILNANELTRSIINGNIGYCDGAGAVMAIRQKGAEADKIAGCELWLKIIGRFHASRTFYIIGGKPDVNTATVEKLRREYPESAS